MQDLNEYYDLVILKAFKIHLDPLLYEEFERNLVLSDARLAKSFSKRKKRKTPTKKARAAINL